MFRKLALPFLALAVAGAAASTSAAATPQTLLLRSVTTQTYMFGVSESAPPAPGARMIFNDVLYNRAAQFGKAAGARVGTAEVSCVITSLHHAQCTIAAHVPNGTLTLLGTLFLKDQLTTERFGVAGGVGAYGSARGTAVGRDVSPTESLITIHLR
jgi:hypothetical protein